MPRRPALPVIWSKSVALSGTNSRPLKRSLCESTTLRAGKLTPAATVEVEKMASSSPSFIRVSTSTFHWGNWPPWWAATRPLRREESCRWFLRYGWFSRSCRNRSLKRRCSSSLSLGLSRGSAASKARLQSALDLRKKTAGNRLR